MQASAWDDARASPLKASHELLQMGNTVPGRPLTSVDDSRAVKAFLRTELSTVRLKRAYCILFLTSSPGNISPLHHQALKGRKVCITERPDLHLLWYYERIFIKPIPKCLFSSAFWDRYLINAKLGDDRDDSFLDEDRYESFREEAEGFLRTYARLIAHESDLDLAKELKLVPNTTTWDGWCNFINEFGHIPDRHVADRYHFGEIRLTRLNFWYSLWHGCSYFEVHHNYATFFARFGAPYIFVFGAVTVILTALQTAVGTYPEWGFYQELSARIVPFTLVLTLSGLGILPTLYAFFQLKELFFFVFHYRKLS